MKTIRGKAIPPPYAAVALAAALALAMVALVSYGLWQERETDMQEARVKTRNLTLALEEHARQSLRRVELLLLRAADALRLASASQRTDPAELRRRLRPLLPVDGFVRDFEFLDREGRSVASSGGDSAGLPQAAGRDYFAVHRDHPHQGTFIGAPHRDSSGGKWILPVSVRIALPEGSFAGVLVAVVDPGSLQPFYDSIDTGANGGVAMFLRSGWIVVRSPFDEKVLTTHWINTPLFPQHLPQAENGTVRQIVVADQVDRIYSYRALKEYPVVVYLGLSVRDILAAWRVHAWTQGSVLLAALAALALIAVLLARQLGRRESMAKALAESEARFRAIYEQAAVGIALRGLDGRWLQVNQKLCDILGYSREELLARTSVELTPPQERGQAEDYNERMRRGELRTYSREKRYVHKDGRLVPVTLTVNVVLGADGKPSHLVSVIEDITERVRSQERARSADERLRAAVEDLGEAVALTDAEDRIVFINRRARTVNASLQSYLEPGQRYEDFLRAAAMTGGVPEAEGREEQWLADRLAMRRNPAGPFEQERQGGIWQLVTDQHLPDGGTITIGLDITERKRAEEALREQTERVKLGQALGRMLTLEWDIGADRLRWSDSPQWLLGPAPAGDYPLFKDLVHPDDRSLFLSERAAAVVSTEHVSARFRIVRTDGEIRWLQSREKMFPDEPGRPRHLLIALQDITEQVHSEEQVRAADELLRAAVEKLDESFCLCDPQERIVLVNRKFREINRAVGQYLEPGTPFVAHMHAGLALGLYLDAVGREEAWFAQRIAERRSAVGPVVLKRQGGIWRQVAVQRLADGSSITIGTDITAQKKVEEALRNINADLERRVAARTAELKAAYQELESFSYSVSHDLRAPLRAISGFSNILRDEEGERLSAEGRRYLAVVDDNARRMGKLVDALLELVRLSRHALERAPLDMTEIARGVCSELSGEYPRARIEVGRMPPAAGDATLVQQVYANLIGNALKYSCKAESPRVEIGAEQGAEGTRYFVRDNGAGFDMAYGGKLFKPFERLHTGPEYQGTGIGLALVRLIIQRHGGTIRAEGSPGRGAVFRFTLGNAAAAG